MSDYTLPKFGTPDQSPFDILSRPRSKVVAPVKMPVKRGEKGVKTLHGISAKFDERTRTNKARELAVIALKTTSFTIASQAASDRTNSIRGRSL